MRDLKVDISSCQVGIQSISFTRAHLDLSFIERDLQRFGFCMMAHEILGRYLPGRHSSASWFSRSSFLSFLVFQVVTPQFPGFPSHHSSASWFSKSSLLSFLVIIPQHLGFLGRYSSVPWFQVIIPQFPGFLGHRSSASWSSLLNFLVFQVVTPQLPSFPSRHSSASWFSRSSLLSFLVFQVVNLTFLVLGRCSQLP
ncbi:hypothetical protein SLEP1_g2096 [Rubroshorea leprosula]|uniref:Uncharacterized protein n=1 Tax=Rubroshorea leprosula TaxID=152421 RepID=A0AAV5HN81_9ROSI|nr:hypothetical protein SLEP1_g2096 [Rubroshorea leprosula]